VKFNVKQNMLVTRPRLLIIKKNDVCNMDDETLLIHINLYNIEKLFFQVKR